MIRGARFWIPMAVFQVVSGLSVFAMMRQYYSSNTSHVSVDASAMATSVPAWPDSITDAGLAKPGRPNAGDLNFDDPIEVSRQANESFNNKQYDRAAQFGNVNEARTALTTAAALNADNEVGQSAANMLANLP